VSSARRVAVGLAAATIGAAAALAGDPFGTYRPEQHLLALSLGAALGGTAGALLPSLAELDRPLRTGLEVVSCLLIALLAHPAGIAVAFSLAVDRRILIAGLLLGALAGGIALARRLGWLEIAVLLAAPLVATTSLHHATFLRSPGIDCAAVGEQPGVTPWSVFPDHVDPALEGALVYDVVANREWIAAAFVKQRDGAGCGAVVVWDPLGRHLLIEEPFRTGGPGGDPGDGCWMTARLVVEGDRLFVPLSSYDGSLRPRLLAYDLSEGPAATLAHAVDLAVDPSDLAMHDGRLFVLSYPRRFAGDGASAVAVVDPGTADTLHIERFEPDGWMTEYLVPSGDALFVTDVFGHLYELDVDTLAVRREVRPGASMLGGAAAGGRLFVAAPYKQEAWVLDQGSLKVLAKLPGGDALRDLEVDHARQRLYGIGYGDGRLYGWSLKDAGRSLGSLEVGRPLRGMALQAQRIWTAGGCGVFEVNSDALEAP
jgi:hypothetical protein